MDVSDLSFPGFYYLEFALAYIIIDHYCSNCSARVENEFVDAFHNKNNNNNHKLGYGIAVFLIFILSRS